MLNSEGADMGNAHSRRERAGAIAAVRFLKAFTGNVAWARTDCYGWRDGHASLFPNGGSGAGVRLYAENATRLQEETTDVSG